MTEPASKNETVLWSCNFWLFLLLGANFWLYPLLPDDKIADWQIDGFFGLILLFAILAQSEFDPRIRRFALLFCGALFLAILIDEFVQTLEFFESLILAFCFGGATIMYFGTIVGVTRVGIDTILAAACTYIFLGMFFAALYALIVEFDATSFEFAELAPDRYDLFYFSFVTLTTLGYGDIIPASELAKMLAVFEALLGQIYVAIVVAAIIGNFTARSSSE